MVEVSRKQVSQNFLRVVCGREVLSKRVRVHCKNLLDFSTQMLFYYLQLHKMRDDEDAVIRNITSELNDHIYPN